MASKTWQVAALVAPVLCLTLAPSTSRAAEPTAQARPAASVLGAVAADQQRIQAHLHGVEAELRAADTSALDGEQLALREASIDRLHTYWSAGVFPQNPGLSAPVPFFFDAAGRACAVGYLVDESGHGHLAHTVEARENNAYVRDMTTSGLPEWAQTHGLSLLELGRIQPSYCGCTQEEELVCGADGNTYANACVATQCAGVTVDHEGACEPGESEAGSWPEGPVDETEGGEDEAQTETDESGGAGSESGAKGCSVGGTPADESGGAAWALFALFAGLSLRKRGS